MKTKEAQSIRTGDVLGDGFVVESVFMSIGSIPHVYFAKGKAYGVVPGTQYLGPFGYKLSVKTPKV